MSVSLHDNHPGPTLGAELRGPVLTSHASAGSAPPPSPRQAGDRGSSHTRDTRTHAHGHIPQGRVEAADKARDPIGMGYGESLVARRGREKGGDMDRRG